ncbi:transposase [Prosthecomicrobium sp. N25]|uniref:transposase n=1 Tax=Prosthecomicrobium sp. N25 TaxID=3129254 RepID=UPI003FCD8468
MSETFSRVEVITGVASRRRFTTEQKLAIVSETMQPGMSISYVARRHGLSPLNAFRVSCFASSSALCLAHSIPGSYLPCKRRCRQQSSSCLTTPDSDGPEHSNTLAGR